MANDGLLNSPQQVMQTAGFSCEYVFRFYNWIYPVQGQSYVDNMAARPAKLLREGSEHHRLLLEKQAARIHDSYSSS